MGNLPEQFWQASLAELKQGFCHDRTSDTFLCLLCGHRIADGVIYRHGDQLYEAKKYMAIHIAESHGSPFHSLLQLDKKLIGLTEHQKSLLELFYAGHSDSDVAQALQAGSTSTIRNHRFSLREKQKQAKIFLAIMELLAEQPPKKPSFIDLPPSHQPPDRRFAITEQENAKILATYFQAGADGPLDHFPQKEKKRVAIIRQLATHFAPQQTYTEKEVNDILKPLYHDYVLLRRYLIEYGFLDRTADGSAYWRKS
ncbi:DUF2087 domain-containing protein [Heliophilum fasciatum]|uniref:Transcriptional regulator n=1 Tax=Heliophilum fasciatum TaxID=35700 RepID=A0A4R2RVS7_9FIRM|nr:DUF2087 domain-containing protein [Heliophilum fasciatum]MCW2276954.1 DNA-binding CsgD family transcriptional regulator [Heliophilum fasciatum]TCP68520.1 transcriptional regulator [Heliophilum fasciatum]